MREDYNRLEEFKKLEKLNSYRIIKSEEIKEVDSLAVVMQHIKTKARIFLLLNSDDNKVFTIGFRTPPKDSTGVAHILEHSVLCGSKKFPVKEPFVELVKGSLNTFLNAMTYPDKTLYPVASYNDKDFDNLCDVYLDAVFNPNIYSEDKIFKQEGWHYELNSREDDLIINGVVYNEMKGAFSSADSVLGRAIMNSLFDNHIYGNESGGDPDYIPELTYEDFLDFHSRYYHPSNSYIYLYGDLDMAKKLIWLDENYLSGYDYREIDSLIPKKSGLESPIKKEFEYSVSENQRIDNAYYLSLNTVVGGETDIIKYHAFSILDYVLLDVTGAVLKEALLEKGICEDVLGGYENGIFQPYFSIIAKNAKLESNEEFIATVKEVLSNLVKEGIDKQSLRAVINKAEFCARERDFGTHPRGLIYCLEIFDTWLYDDEKIYDLLKFEDIFKELKRLVETDYFEKLIEDSLLNNSFESNIILKPVKNLSDAKDELVKEKLALKKSSLTEEEIESIINETIELKKYQSEPSKDSDLAKIPSLKIEDIEREVKAPIWEKRYTNSGVPIIFSEIFTSGIAYVNFIFNADFISGEKLPYLGLLKAVLGSVDTENFSYAKLATNINLNSGGIEFSTASYTKDNILSEASLIFKVKAKVLYEKLNWLMDIVKEIILFSDLKDVKRLKNITGELKLRIKERLLSAGHTTSMNRALSKLSKSAFLQDALEGIEYYKFLESLDFDNNAEFIIENLSTLIKQLFTRDNLLLHLISDEEGYEVFYESVEDFLNILEESSDRGEGFVFEADNESEAFLSPSMVNYIARAGSFDKERYTGALIVLKNLLSYDYLWNNVRVMGGAYGCMSLFNRTGTGGFVSYRDPKLLETDKVYEGIFEFVKDFKATDKEMTKAIIGAISEQSRPLTPLLEGMKGFLAYYNNVTKEMLQKERDEILDADVEDIRALSDIVASILSEDIKVAIGNAAKINESKDGFDKILSLYEE